MTAAALVGHELVGHELPRIYTKPLRRLTRKTSLGYEVIDFARDVLKVDLFPWQKWWLIHALELLPSGAFRFRKVLLLVARQNGKSTVLQVLALWRIYLDGALMVIGTAQSLDIAEEVWDGAVQLAEGVPDLAAEIEHVDKTNGKKALVLTTKARYKVAAATRRGGRGLSGELILLDELREHHNFESWSAVTKTTNAMERAQIIGASNAGDLSSVVLRTLRNAAIATLGDEALAKLEGVPMAATLDDEDDFDESSLAIFEWSAEPKCAVMDRDQWMAANPSCGHPRGVILSALIADAQLALTGSDLEWDFRVEDLCQWRPTSGSGPFPEGTWTECLDADSQIPKAGDLAACVEVSWDRTMAYVGVAGRREDGRIHVEIVALRPGTDWVVDWFGEEKRRGVYKLVAVQQNGAPASSLIDALVAADVPVELWGGAELGKASGGIFDLVKQKKLAHIGQDVLDLAAATAHTKPMGDGWVFDRKHSPADASPLIAVAGAAWALPRIVEESESAYENSDLVVV